MLFFSDEVDVKVTDYAMLAEALEAHYILARKPIVDKAQEIEQQIELFKSNALVVASLQILKGRTEDRLQELKSGYERMLGSLEYYAKTTYQVGHVSLV